MIKQGGCEAGGGDSGSRTGKPQSRTTLQGGRFREDAWGGVCGGTTLTEGKRDSLGTSLLKTLGSTLSPLPLGEQHPFGHKDPTAIVAPGIWVGFEAKDRDSGEGAGAPPPAPDHGRASKGRAGGGPGWAKRPCPFTGRKLAHSSLAPLDFY